MRRLSLVVVALLLALGSWIVPVTWAADHVIVDPKDLKWEDVPALPTGAKVAIIEGPMDQATPFTERPVF